MEVGEFLFSYRFIRIEEEFCSCFLGFLALSQGLERETFLERGRGY